MSYFEVQCGSCNKLFRANSDHAGMVVACPTCSTHLQVPHPPKPRSLSKKKSSKRKDQVFLRCGGCNKKLKIAKRKLGREANCPRCGAHIVTPTLGQYMEMQRRNSPHPKPTEPSSDTPKPAAPKVATPRDVPIMVGQIDDELPETTVIPVSSGESAPAVSNEVTPGDQRAPEKLSVRCPQCDAKLKYSRDKIGQQKVCPRCKTTITLGANDPTASASPQADVPSAMPVPEAPAASYPLVHPAVPIHTPIDPASGESIPTVTIPASQIPTTTPQLVTPVLPGNTDGTATQLASSTAEAGRLPTWVFAVVGFGMVALVSGIVLIALNFDQVNRILANATPKESDSGAAADGPSDSSLPDGNHEGNVESSKPSGGTGASSGIPPLELSTKLEHVIPHAAYELTLETTKRGRTNTITAELLIPEQSIPAKAVKEKGKISTARPVFQERVTGLGVPGKQILLPASFADHGVEQFKVVDQNQKAWSVSKVEPILDGKLLRLIYNGPDFPRIPVSRFQETSGNPDVLHLNQLAEPLIACSQSIGKSTIGGVGNKGWEKFGGAAVQPWGTFCGLVGRGNAAVLLSSIRQGLPDSDVWFEAIDKPSKTQAFSRLERVKRNLVQVVLQRTPNPPPLRQIQYQLNSDATNSILLGQVRWRFTRFGVVERYAIEPGSANPRKYRQLQLPGILQSPIDLVFPEYQDGNSQWSETKFGYFTGVEKNGTQIVFDSEEKVQSKTENRFQAKLDYRVKSYNAQNKIAVIQHDFQMEPRDENGLFDCDGSIATEYDTRLRMAIKATVKSKVSYQENGRKETCDVRLSVRRLPQAEAMERHRNSCRSRNDQYFISFPIPDQKLGDVDLKQLMSDVVNSKAEASNKAIAQLLCVQPEESKEMASLMPKLLESHRAYHIKTGVIRTLFTRWVAPRQIDWMLRNTKAPGVRDWNLLDVLLLHPPIDSKNVETYLKNQAPQAATLRVVRQRYPQLAEAVYLDYLKGGFRFRSSSIDPVQVYELLGEHGTNKSLPLLINIQKRMERSSSANKSSLDSLNAAIDAIKVRTGM